ncbi:MAG: carbohydrate ABC transporter permease [Anaerocolumna sp.]
MKKRLSKVGIGAYAGIYVFISLFPLLFSLLSSFKDNNGIYASPFALPDSFSWENYIYAFKNTTIIQGMLNSLLYSILSVIAVIVMALCISFVFRIDVPFKQGIFLFFIAGLTLPVHATLIPLATIINQLHLKNSIIGIVGVYAATNLSLAVFLANGYMKGISKELDEAARIDGCGYFGLLIKVLTPLMKPVIATIAIMTFLRVYNDLIFSILLISDRSKATLSVALMAFKSEYDINYGGTFAGICISVFPMIIIYFKFQKQIETGLSAGSVKG